MFLTVQHSDHEADDRLMTIAVLVLGMHRSGTSSTAGTLVLLGGRAPRHLMPPSADNEKGFWESTVVADLNDSILAAGGSDWRDWRKFDPGKIDLAAADALRARAKAVLAEEFGHARFPIIKAPRMCRLMPFWAPVFEEAKWAVRALLPIRSPLEVGWSLNFRDGMGTSYGCLLWLRHVLEAEVETRGMARAVLSWPHFLDDRRGALARVGKQLGLTWPSWCESALEEIDEFVTADLRHQKAEGDDLHEHPAISDLVRETYEAMLELVQDPANGCVLRRIDDLRARFESAAAVFDHPMRELEEKVRCIQSQAAAERSEFARQLADAKSESDAHAERILEAIAHVADRFAETSRVSKRNRFRGSLKVWSKKAIPSPVNPKDLEVIRNSVFFDAEFYLETNPDVNAARVDPALHYLLHGGAEGRDPGPYFSTKAYFNRRPDAAEAGENALLHLTKHVRKRERRSAIR